MRTRLTFVVAMAVSLCCAASAASAATLSVDRPCYADASQRKDLVSYSGSGFTPGASFQVTFDKAPLPGGTGTVDSAGDVAGSFVAPSLGKRHEHTYPLSVSDGTNTAETSFKVAKLFADFTPTKGNPKTLKVVFSLFGFGLQGDPNPVIYLHYVRPDGKLQKTRSLGHGRGVCGTRNRTARQPLFGFNAVHGSWKLQFDTSKKYRRGKAGADFLFYVIPVSVKKS